MRTPSPMHARTSSPSMPSPQSVPIIREEPALGRFAVDSPGDGAREGEGYTLRDLAWVGRPRGSEQPAVPGVLIGIGVKEVHGDLRTRVDDDGRDHHARDVPALIR